MIKYVVIIFLYATCNNKDGYMQPKSKYSFVVIKNIKKVLSALSSKIRSNKISSNNDKKLSNSEENEIRKIKRSKEALYCLKFSSYLPEKKIMLEKYCLKFYTLKCNNWKLINDMLCYPWMHRTSSKEKFVITHRSPKNSKGAQIIFYHKDRSIYYKISISIIFIKKLVELREWAEYLVYGYMKKYFDNYIPIDIMGIVSKFFIPPSIPSHYFEYLMLNALKPVDFEKIIVTVECIKKYCEKYYPH